VVNGLWPQFYIFDLLQHSRLKHAKKISAWFLLALFAFNVLFAHLILGLQEAQVRSRMSVLASGISSLDETGLIRVPLNELEAYRGDEITLDGRLYDVVKREVKGDVVNIFVLNDHEEESILAQVGAHLELAWDKLVHKNASGAPLKETGKDLSQKYFNTRDFALPGQPVSAAFILHSDRLHGDRFTSILVPPPQHA
jgi:hypothetical protein